MSNLPFDTIALSDQEITFFEATHKLLKEKFRLEIPGDIDFCLEQFEVFRPCVNINPVGEFVIKNLRGDSYLLYLALEHQSKPIKGRITHFTEYQPWALAYLKKDFGRVLIRPETLTDKILEIIHPIELDFREDKAFSTAFYVLTDDRDKANIAMDQHFRNALMPLIGSDFVIEIFEHTLIIGNRKTITPENSIYLAEFIARIALI